MNFGVAQKYFHITVRRVSARVFSVSGPEHLVKLLNNVSIDAATDDPERLKIERKLLNMDRFKGIFGNLCPIPAMQTAGSRGSASPLPSSDRRRNDYSAKLLVLRGAIGFVQ